jgi:hypothetical protein
MEGGAWGLSRASRSRFPDRKNAEVGIRFCECFTTVQIYRKKRERGAGGGLCSDVATVNPKRYSPCRCDLLELYALFIRFIGGGDGINGNHMMDWDAGTFLVSGRGRPPDPFPGIVLRVVGLISD